MSRSLLKMISGLFSLPASRRGPNRLGRHGNRACRLGVEDLEDRCLLSGGMQEFMIPTAGGTPFGITAGPDGNVWFAEYLGNKIGRMTPGGSITEFTIPTQDSHSNGITAGPDGNVWFVEGLGNKIGRITPAGSITEFQTGLSPNSGPRDITAGPDGNLWFTENYAQKIGTIAPDGTITENPMVLASRPGLITVGPDGNLWFTETHPAQLGRATTTGQVTEFPVPGGSSPTGIATGSDGNLWFADQDTNKIYRRNTNGTFTSFAAPGTPTFLTAAPDGNLWFTEQWGNKLGRITTGGKVSEFAIPTASSQPLNITVGPDSDLWFCEYLANQIGKFYLLSARGTSLTETAGQKFAAIVASFHDDQPGMVATNYTSLIKWGDGSPVSTGGVSSNGDGTWDIAASHTYAAAGSYTVTVTITDTHKGGMKTTATTVVQVVSGSSPLVLTAAPTAGFGSPDGTAAAPVDVPVSQSPGRPHPRKLAGARHSASALAVLLGGNHYRVHPVRAMPEHRHPGVPGAGVSTSLGNTAAHSVGLLFALHHRPHGLPAPLGPLEPSVIDALAADRWF
jgi:streptogramin lyase